MARPFRLKIFGDTYVEETPNGTLKLYVGGSVISPYEYEYLWDLSPNARALRRHDDERVDVVFASGVMSFGAFYAQDIGAIGEDGDRHLIALLVASKTLIVDDTGHYIMFVAGYPFITTLYDRFLVVCQPNDIIPHVRIYDLDGKIVSEGLPLEARDEARKRLLNQ
jgi:hypothetical protein